jgi:hypothetical protein
MDLSNYSGSALSSGCYEMNYNLLYMPIFAEISDEEDPALLQPEEDEDDLFEDEMDEEDIDHEEAEEEAEEEDYEAEEEEDSYEEDGSEILDSEDGSYGYTYTATVNVLIYDIPKNEKRLLFEPGELEEGASINGIFFEQAHYADGNYMLFNEEPTELRNNFNIPEREPRNKILIEVHLNRRQEYQLWTCDKWGGNKECLAAWKDGNSSFMWHLDLLNGQIRVMSQIEQTWQMNEFPW